jgi:hypothetical protein
VGRSPVGRPGRDLIIRLLQRWAVQAVAGVTEYNDDRLDHRRAPIALVHSRGTANYWERTLQNWQSEFLAPGGRRTRC